MTTPTWQEIVDAANNTGYNGYTLKDASWGLDNNPIDRFNMTGVDPSASINRDQNGMMTSVNTAIPGDRKYAMNWAPDGQGGVTQQKAKYGTSWLDTVSPGALAGMMAAVVGGGIASGWGGMGGGLPTTGPMDLMGSVGTGLEGAASAGGGGLFGGFNFPSLNMPGIGDIGSKLGSKLLSTGLSSIMGGGGGSQQGQGNGMDFNLGGLLSGALNNYATNQNISSTEGAANTSAANLNALAAQLDSKGKFTPYNVRSGLGTTQLVNGELQNYMDPRFRDPQNLALAQQQKLLTPYQNSQVDALSNQAYGQAGQYLNKQVNPLYAQNEQAGLFGAGNLMRQAGGFDPEAEAAKQYALSQKILSPQREQDNLAMENRMLAQGRLGMANAPELNAMKLAQANQDLQLQQQSRQTGYNMQNNLLSQAQALQGLGAGSGASGMSMDQGNKQMAQGLFGMGMSGNKFISDMNGQQISQAGQLLQQAMLPEQMLLQQQSQGIQGGQAASSAAANNNNLLANLGKAAEGVRYDGVLQANALRNQRNSNLYGQAGQAAQGIFGGAGGLLGSLFGGGGPNIGSPIASIGSGMGDFGMGVGGLSSSDLGILKNAGDAASSSGGFLSDPDNWDFF